MGRCTSRPIPCRASRDCAPDILIAFDADPEVCARHNAYIFAEQGPDFVLEVASRSTGHIDVEDKPADYAAPGIPEHWRFDETGESHGARLTGDR
ncbi:MAG: Uma2 family endonuclease [Caldilineaceae bacterium SB0665_bin_21]|nr:Uma2 family endonuclease [Caldilineaceae bacterium SB0665_bin_21]